MSGKNKNYNSIIFLTTLSVYLGLVLVSGSPQVLAYAATTRNFDIQHEIEFKDDLDNKPDNEESEILSENDFPTLFAQVLRKVKDNVKSGKINLPLQDNFQYSGELTILNSYGIGSIGEPNSKLDSVFQASIDYNFLPKAIKLANYVALTKKAKVNIQGNKTEVLLKISVSKSKSEQFAKSLNDEFSTLAISVKDKLLKQIYENTKATFENNQIFIITNLPRASIDSVLK